MNISKRFVERPVATALLTLGVVLVGIVAYLLLPISSLPQVDFPTIAVQASLPGADAETMAATVASPLEQQFANIPGVTRTLPLALYTAMQSPDGDPLALRLALLSFALGLAGLLMAELLVRRVRRRLGR